MLPALPYRPPLAAAFLMGLTCVPAGAGEDLWDYLPGTTSGILADKGMRLVTSTGLSWPDGSQAIVTFWKEKRGAYIRCITYFDKSMVYTGDKCERGKASEEKKAEKKKTAGETLIPEKNPARKPSAKKTAP